MLTCWACPLRRRSVLFRWPWPDRKIRTRGATT
jgi:hypothetical protein